LGAVGVTVYTTFQLRRARRLVSEATAVEDELALDALVLASQRLAMAAPRSFRTASLQTTTLRTTSLLESHATPVPFAWRGSERAIVLPAHWHRWDGERLTVVMVHELAHLNRKDSLALWIGRAATAAWWFHPLVHRLDRWARQECERAADDAVLLSGSRASDYADHLLAIGRALAQPNPVGVSLMMSKSPDFKQRLTAILRADQPRKTLTRRLALGATATALGAAVALAGVQFAPKADAQEEDKAKRASQHYGHEHDHNYDHDSDHKKTYPEGPEGDAGRAMEAHRSGRYEEAIALFESSAAAGHRPAVSTYNAACGYSLSGRSGEAMDALRKAIDLGLDDPELIAEDSDLDPLRASSSFQALVDEAFAQAGETRDPVEHYRYRTALERIDLLRKANSQSSDSWSDAARDLLYMGEPDAAAEAYSNAIRLDSEPSSNTIYNLACVYAMDGQKAQALKTLEQAVEAGYSDPKHMMKDPDLASLRGETTFERLVALADDLDLNRYRSKIWEERHKNRGNKKHGEHGDYSEYSTTAWAPAIEFYRGFVQDNPKLGAGWLNLGYSLHYSKRFPEAIDAFEKASQLGFRPSTSTYNVACGLSMLNRVDSAIAALERSIELGLDRHSLEDDDLDNLRGEARFRAIVLEMEMARKERYSK